MQSSGAAIENEIYQKVKKETSPSVNHQKQSSAASNVESTSSAVSKKRSVAAISTTTGKAGTTKTTKSKKSSPSGRRSEIDHFPVLQGNALQDFLVPDSCTAESINRDLMLDHFPSSSSAKNKDSFMDMAVLAAGGEFDGATAEDMFLRSRSSSFADDSTQTTSDGLESVTRRERAEKERSESTVAAPKAKKASKKMSSVTAALSEEEMLLDLTPGTASQVQAAKLSAKLTAKEKNREHAKNTRMRKKKYIESLKESIKILSDEKEKMEREKRISLNRTMEQNTVRKRVLQDFLNFRTKCILDRNLWATLLEENAMMMLPITPYRSFPPIEVYEGQRYVKGIEAIMLDTASLSVFFQSIVPVVADDEASRVEAFSTCNFQDSVVNEDSLMTSWDIVTTNAVQFGSRCELSVHGMLKVTFSSYNKIIYVELSFDVMSVMQQIRRASNRNDFQVIPNTPALALESCREPRVILEGSHPYNILFTNQDFQLQFPFPNLLGNSFLSTIQSRIVEREKVAELNEFLVHFLPFCSIVTMYTTDNVLMRVWLKIYPLYAKAMPSQFLCVLESLPGSHAPSVVSSYYSSSSATSSSHSSNGNVVDLSRKDATQSNKAHTLAASSTSSSCSGVTSNSSITRSTAPSGSVSVPTTSSIGAPKNHPLMHMKSPPGQELAFPTLNGTLDVAYQRPYQSVVNSANNTDFVANTAVIASNAVAPGLVNRLTTIPQQTQQSSSTSSGNSITSSSQSGIAGLVTGTSSISHAYRRSILQKQQKLQEQQEQVQANHPTVLPQLEKNSVSQDQVMNVPLDPNTNEEVDNYFSEFLQDFSMKSVSSYGGNLTGSSSKTSANTIGLGIEQATETGKIACVNNVNNTSSLSLSVLDSSESQKDIHGSLIGTKDSTREENVSSARALKPEL